MQENLKMIETLTQFGIFAGLMGLYHALSQEKRTWRSVLLDVLASATAGIVTGLLMEGLDANIFLTFAAVGASGSMGSKALDLIHAYTEKKVK